MVGCLPSMGKEGRWGRGEKEGRKKGGGRKKGDYKENEGKGDG